LKWLETSHREHGYLEKALSRPDHATVPTVSPGISRTIFRTHIQDNEEQKIDAVKKHKNPKEPPSSFAGEEEGEAAARVVQKEAELLVDRA